MNAQAAKPYKQTPFHEIDVRSADGWSWCRLLWEEHGRVIILSDHGCWSHWWGHRGDGVSVPAFLAKVGRDYAGGKMLWPNAAEFDIDLTVRSAKLDIIHSRRSGHLSKEDAREEWDALVEIGNEWDFYQWASDSRIEGASEHHTTSIARAWVNFWDQLWVPCVLPELKKLVEAA